MQPFVYNAHPARVIFGSGTLSQLPAEVERLGLERALVLATPQQEADAQELATRLGQRAAGVYANATMHTPVAVTEDAMRMVAERQSTDSSRSVADRRQGSPRRSRSAPTYRRSLPRRPMPGRR